MLINLKKYNRLHANSDETTTNTPELTQHIISFFSQQRFPLREMSGFFLVI